jgi:hypothetical protein
MKKLYIFLALIACLYISNKACPEGFNNSLSLLLENNFYIPQESCLCAFIKTVDDEGSGEGWLYGEDNDYYYGPNTESKFKVENYFTVITECDPEYYILRKGQESKNFDKFNSKTWDKKIGVRINPVPEILRGENYKKKCDK